MIRKRPVPFRINRFQPSQDPYAKHILYGIAKGFLSPVMIEQIGLERMSYLPERPHFTETPRGVYLTGTNTDRAPSSAEPYSCRSEVISSLAYALKWSIYGARTRDIVFAIGLNPDAIRSCLP